MNGPEAWGTYLLILLIAFVAVVGWAFNARRRKRFERDARIPLEEDPEFPGRGPD